ncbi:hypothetical protein [Anabaena azotica]|uniref:Uncharacterized protein n=1 Tax=Anabaena azotica FACHB-119 TaxID=947527 RepID=A0ABR8DEV2_9NOST|nr:hypothetical protein [Anabaena azotica]MBD2505166.1 hypothetical protein [Anabaena azotica FACHB-119]
MTYPTYSHQQLQNKSIAGLKKIYSEIGCTVEITNRYSKNSWVAAIADYQAGRIHKIAPLALDEQAIAQAELYQHIAQQAQDIAPEELTTQQINPHHFEVYAGNRLVAYISYDNSEYVTQRWVVMVCGEEKFRHFAISQCHRFIDWHHKDGTLNPLSPAKVPDAPTVQEISLCDQELVIQGEQIASVEFDDHNYQDLYWRVMVNGCEIFRDTTPARCHSYVKQQYQQGELPVQQEFEECGTDNEIMALLADECQKQGLKLLDDGVYRGDVRLGQAGCTDGHWWVIRSGESQERVPTDSAIDAVWWLSMVDTFAATESIDCEQLLDLPFEILTADDWQRLLEYQPDSDLVAA